MDLSKWFCNPDASSSEKEEEVIPKFLLQETVEEYRWKLMEMKEDRKQYNLTRDALLEQACKVENLSGSLAQKELNRREAEEIRREAEEIQSSINHLVRLLEALEKKLHKKEAKMIPYKGKVLASTKESKNYKERNQFLLYERRVVKYQGKYFLALLRYKEITEDTGEKESRLTGRDRRRGPYLEKWPIVTRTGNYELPELLWCTDALEQFTEDELRVVAQEV